MVEFLHNIEYQKGEYMQHKIHKLHMLHDSFNATSLFSKLKINNPSEVLVSSDIRPSNKESNVLQSSTECLILL